MNAVETTAARSVGEVLDWTCTLINPARRFAVEALPASMCHIAGYHFGWWDSHGVLNGGTGGGCGKGIRPALTLLAAAATGSAPEAAVPVAAAVELVHNFSLLHDDVMDGDRTRRGRLTAWAVFGSAAAILAGDALVTAAFRVLAASGYPAAGPGTELLSTAVLEMIGGQRADMALERRTDATPAECLAMVAGKTGALMGAATALRACCAGGCPDQVGHLRRFGAHLGMAFQHTDDLLGIWGDPLITGKPAYADLQRRKKSLPVVAALGSGSAAGAELAALYRSQQPLSDAELEHAAELATPAEDCPRVKEAPRMSHTDTTGIVAATTPTRLAPGTVLVADELHGPDRVVLACPAAPLLAGELRRRGLATAPGPLHLTGTREEPEEPARTGSGAAVILPATGGRAGLGLATAGGTDWLAARSALADWASVSGDRSVLLASPRSFCAGVDRAIEIVERALQQRDGPVYVRKQIVHNTHVVAELSARGAVFVDELDAVPAGATVVFSAHGVSPAVRAQATGRGLEVIDATCPLVAKVHTEARRFAGRGDTVILVGHREHEEIEGVLGEAPARTTVVATVADVEALQVQDPERVSYLTQTTLGAEETAEVIAALHARFPALRGPASADICYATTNRQNALSAIAEDCDLVLVVGSENSSNSQRLVELAHLRGTPGYLIDAPGDIRPGWLAGVRVVGLTAGASAPTHLVEDVITALGGLGGLTVTDREIAREDIAFTLPSALRSPSGFNASASSRGDG